MIGVAEEEPDAAYWRIWPDIHLSYKSRAWGGGHGDEVCFDSRDVGHLSRVEDRSGPKNARADKPDCATVGRGVGVKHRVKA